MFNEYPVSCTIRLFINFDDSKLDNLAPKIPNKPECLSNLLLLEFVIFFVDFFRKGFISQRFKLQAIMICKLKVIKGSFNLKTNIREKQN